jgi:hypothetical protein
LNVDLAERSGHSDREGFGPSSKAGGAGREAGQNICDSGGERLIEHSGGSSWRKSETGCASEQEDDFSHLAIFFRVRVHLVSFVRTRAITSLITDQKEGLKVKRPPMALSAARHYASVASARRDWGC